MKKGLVAMVLVAVLAIAPQAFAHDYWLMPDSFDQPTGHTQAIHLNFGEEMLSEPERRLSADTVQSLVMVSASGSENLPLPCLPWAAGTAMTPKAPGTYLLALARKGEAYALSGQEFTEYLQEEHLTQILAAREQAGQTNAAGKEFLTRFGKTLIQVGGAHDATFGHVMGHTLEIVPLADPATIHAGEPLDFEVLFAGQPLAGATVTAYQRNNFSPKSAPALALTQPTDASGHAAITFQKPGPCLVRVWHMRAANGRHDVDWESFGTDLVFAIQ
jgi:uncharacterized GH25 family protein